MNSSTFEAFRRIVYEQSGISLSQGKEALITARVRKRIGALRLDTLEEYLDVLGGPNCDSEFVHLVDAISTNVTSFFREYDHFEFLMEEVRRWRLQGQQRFRIWSAACSTGEEPLSIAMALQEVLGDGSHDTRVLATDISTRALSVARAGRYPATLLESMPPQFRHHFVPVRDRNSSQKDVAVKSQLLERIAYRRLNLSRAPYPMQGPMDVVFCRNVMIYFDTEVKQRLVSEATRLLKPGGYLIVGHTESLSGISARLRLVRPSVFVKPES